jgi:uncharacterized short protein YbdD (DUF466 family)
MAITDMLMKNLTYLKKASITLAHRSMIGISEYVMYVEGEY